MKFPVCSRGKLPFPRRIFLFDISERSAPAFYSRSATCAFLIKPGLDSQQHSRGCLRRRRQSKTKRCDATRAFAKGIQGRKSIAKVRGGGGRRECERSPRDVNAVTHAAKRAADKRRKLPLFHLCARGRRVIFHGRRLRDESASVCHSAARQKGEVQTRGCCRGHFQPVSARHY